jgi:hypothetical protein
MADADMSDFNYDISLNLEVETAEVFDHDYSTPTPGPEDEAVESDIVPECCNSREIADKCKKQSTLENFTVRSPSMDTKHLPRNISASDRAKSYPSELYESGASYSAKSATYWSIIIEFHASNSIC